MAAAEGSARIARSVGHPNVAVTIDDEDFSQSVPFVGRRCHDVVTAEAGRGFDRIGIGVMQPEFDTITALIAKTRSNRVVVVGVVGMQHDFRRTMPDDGEIGVFIDNSGTQHRPMEGNSRRDSAHQQIDPES